MNWKKHLRSIGFLVLLQLLLDMLYVYLYPSVNPIRATLIGFSALAVLWLPWVTRFVKVHPGVGFLSIYSSALFGALLVQAGILTSKSLLSGIVHVLILIVTYVVITLIVEKYKKE